LVSSVGLAIIAVGLLVSSISESKRSHGAVGVALGLFVVSSWWASDGRRSRHYLYASAILAITLAALLLVMAARSLRYSHFVAVLQHLVQPGTPFPAACGTGISQALAGGGSCLLCVSLVAFLETSCWARRR